jgi:hypothetical protein
MLADERRLRIKAEEHNYELMVMLAKHGIEPPLRRVDEDPP